MLDATQLVQINMPVSFLSNMLDATAVMVWGVVGMLTFLELAHILDATQLWRHNNGVNLWTRLGALARKTS